ncbi:EAL-associated domain-containing protein [Bacillus sp. REN3]|uniref:EAL domain-containing protein n=1 Tax=Bacillus sp. REN3 TaxID=2802440 RepID=UPI001AEF2E46|nr:EAL-associated domain-containing protein [Bacillus sp. REN3]
MDALDILADLDHVSPHFQPIFNAEEHKIIGYEILGRYRKGNEVFSLGPFFKDEQIPEEFRMEVDQAVLDKALEKAAQLNDQELLWFVNRDLELLMLDNGEQFIQHILRYKERGLQPEQIVLEISEWKSETENGSFEHLIQYFKSYGIKLAVDTAGNASNQAEQIVRLSPEILKIDMSFMRTNSTGTAYLDILHSMSILARKIGATLLFERIETPFQLQFAWKNGGRYYQGFYLHKPGEVFLDKNILKERFKKECHGFILSEKKRLQSFFDLKQELNTFISDIVGKIKKQQDENEFLMALAKPLEEMAFRMYICDEDGFQKSANIFKEKEDWILQPEYEEKNWSWRPYFLENIIRMRVGKKGIISDRYSDIETGEMIRTFSLPLSDDRYLFVDLCSSYLYKKEGLF